MGVPNSSWVDSEEDFAPSYHIYHVQKMSGFRQIVKPSIVNLPMFSDHACQSESVLPVHLLELVESDGKVSEASTVQSRILGNLGFL